MADKVSALILEVDLECKTCIKKIKKVLCKIQRQERINTINYNEKKNTVTISGPFDPKCLSKKIYSMASCEVIMSIQIKKPETPKPPPPPPVCCPRPWPNCCCKPCPCFSQSHGGRWCCNCSWMCCAPPSSRPCCPSGCCPGPCQPPPGACYKFVCEDVASPNPCLTM